MASEFLQFLFSGVTVGATYALVALGFSIIYNASHVINFAQGEFVMLGGMSTVFLVDAGVPMGLAVILAVALTMAVGGILERLAIDPAKGGSRVPLLVALLSAAIGVGLWAGGVPKLIAAAVGITGLLAGLFIEKLPFGIKLKRRAEGDTTVVTLIIITIGASIFVRGLTQVVMDKEFHALQAFSGETPILIGGATLLPQSLWVLGGTGLIVIVLSWFFGRTMMGKAMLATSINPLAAQLVGINTRNVLLMSFGLSALLGAMGGILVAPITNTYYEVGIMLGLKGFCAAILGGLGNGLGAVVGGLIVGIAEAMGAGYLSSEYKDAMAFILILGVLFFMPSGLFGKKGTERV